MEKWRIEFSLRSSGETRVFKVQLLQVLLLLVFLDGVGRPCQTAALGRVVQGIGIRDCPFSYGQVLRTNSLKVLCLRGLRTPYLIRSAIRVHVRSSLSRICKTEKWRRGGGEMDEHAQGKTQGSEPRRLEKDY